jgi:hypothetical protein
MERLSRVLVSGLAVALMASVTLSVVAQGAGVDYWNDVVKGSSPTVYMDLNNATPGTAGQNSCLFSYGHFYDHVSGGDLGMSTLCYLGSQAQHSDGSPGAYATSTMLHQDLANTSSGANIFIDPVGPEDGGGAWGMSVWTKLDGCVNAGGSFGTINILRPHGDGSGGSMPVVSTSDCGQHVVLTDYESGSWVSHVFAGPGTGRWFMSALVWSAGVLTYYTGYQGEGVVEHTEVESANGIPTGSLHWGFELGGGGSGAWTAEWWGLGVWRDAAATALLSAPAGNTGNAATWLGILNSFTPFALTPGLGCVATTAGPQQCTSNSTQKPAPLSGSTKKFQLGYLPIVDCGAFPTIAVSSFFGISLTIPDPVGFVPWALCNAQDVLFMGINALIFAANVAIDLVVPDGSGLDSWAAIGADASTRFPFGYLGIAGQVGRALGSPSDLGTYSCTATVGSGVSSCGFSGGSGAFDFTLLGHTTSIDLPSKLYPLLHPWLGAMSAVIYGGFGLGLLRAVRGDMAGNPE